MPKPTYTVAVTGLNAIDNPGPGVPVIRALKESPDFEVRIVGLAYETLEPGLYLPDHVEVSYQIPYPQNGHEVLLSRILEIHAEENLDVIIPNFDAELFSFIKLKPLLAEYGIQMLVPDLAQFEARQKAKLEAFAEPFGVKVPKSETIHSVAALRQAFETFSFPMMIKGKFYEAYVAHSEEQALAYFYKLSNKWGTPIIIQEFVKGQELNVTALGDGHGRLMGAVPMRKTYITDNGKGWAGVSIADPHLLAMARRVVEGSKWAGGMELELIKEDQTGEVYLIEINPRFPAWVYFAAGCGQNHPAALVQLAMGESIEPFTHYEVGKMFIRYAYDLICDMADLAEFTMTGKLDKRGILV